MGHLQYNFLNRIYRTNCFLLLLKNSAACLRLTLAIRTMWVQISPNLGLVDTLHQFVARKTRSRQTHVVTVSLQGDRRRAVWGHRSQGVLQWSGCQVAPTSPNTHTHTRTDACTLSNRLTVLRIQVIMHLCLLHRELKGCVLGLVCVFTYGRLRGMVQLPSLWGISELFIRMINDTKPAVLIMTNLAYSASFVPPQRNAKKECVCVLS